MNKVKRCREYPIIDHKNRICRVDGCNEPCKLSFHPPGLDGVAPTRTVCKKHYNERARKPNRKRRLDLQNDPKKWVWRKVRDHMSKAKYKGQKWKLDCRDITDRILMQGKCKLSDKEFVYKFNSPFSPSIDRIDSSKGYTPCNIQFVCTSVNLAKLDAPQEQFIDMCKRVAKKSKNNNLLLSKSMQ
jgi:hypothetical protein